MSIIAAFLWNKSPRCSISTMIFDDENLEFLSSPKLQVLPSGYFKFRKAAINIIKNFYAQITKCDSKELIVIEYRIVFHTNDIPFMVPSRESKLVHHMFIKYFKKCKRERKNLHLESQLRNRLSGKDLKQFKHGLRSLFLVSRKRHAGFEYHLWTVALHATPSTFADKLKRIRLRLIKLANEKEAKTLMK